MLDDESPLGATVEVRSPLRKKKQEVAQADATADASTADETVAPESPERLIDPIVELERLGALKEKGLLTEEEFAAQKRKLLK